MTNTALASSAILGILMGAACGGSKTQPASPTTAGSAPSTKERASCGNHEPGKCAAMSPAPPPLAPSDKPLSITRTETIAPGKAIEVNLSFRSASKTRATFKASGPVAWNVHSHPASGMVEHQKGTSATGDIAFEPPSLGVYSLMWENNGVTPVTLEIDVRSDSGVAELKH